MNKIQQLGFYQKEGIYGWKFFCPGCNENHAYLNDGRWTFNGDFEKPTFSPSLLIRSGHYMPEHDGGSCWCTYSIENPDKPSFKCGICHIYMTDGRIQYLNDCTHALAGQTIDVPDWED